jgi:hypothetical protein
MKTAFYLIPLTFLTFACGSGTPEKDSSTESINEKKVTENKQESDEKEPVWTSGLVIKKEKLKAENCIDVPMEEWMEEQPEPFCASVEVSLIKVSLNDEAVAQKINAQIASAITGKKNNTNLRAFVNKVKSLSEIEEAANDEYSCSLIDTTNRLISIAINNFQMAYGAAHPNAMTTVLNFDLETGSIIGIKDVLVEDYLKSLKGIVMKKFLKKNGKEGWDFSNVNNFKLSENIALEKKGIRFMYNPYEIGPYAAGAPEVLVTWDELKDLRKENQYNLFK